VNDIFPVNGVFYCCLLVFVCDCVVIICVCPNIILTHVVYSDGNSI